MNNRFKNRVPFFTVIGQAYLSDQIEDAENNVWKIDTIDGGVILFDHSGKDPETLPEDYDWSEGRYYSSDGGESYAVERDPTNEGVYHIAS